MDITGCPSVEEDDYSDTEFGNLFDETDFVSGTFNKEVEVVYPQTSVSEEEEEEGCCEDDVPYSFTIPGEATYNVSDSRKVDQVVKVKGDYPVLHSRAMESETRNCIPVFPSKSDFVLSAQDKPEHFTQDIQPQDSRQLTTQMSKEDFDHCVICMDNTTNPKILDKCSHTFCTECIEEYFKHRPVCPVCFVPYGIITGTQPEGYMDHRVIKSSVSGYPGYKTIVVTYGFESGIQGPEHPHPGVPYSGTDRTGYLPDNEDGRKVLALLKVAFKRRLVFTIGRSRTTGCDNTVTWNDIHHKTSTNGGQESFGYPDPTYLERVQQELAAFGVTEESLNMDK